MSCPNHDATTAVCPTCQMPDGTPNAAYLRSIGLCTLCGSCTVPWGEPGAGFCTQGEHSANRAECEGCGRVYEDWDNGTWEAEGNND